MNQLKEMLEAYSNGERGLPTYDELAALAALAEVAEDMVLVPKSPTLEMLEAANIPRRLNFDSLSIYKAMIEASPFANQED